MPIETLRFATFNVRGIAKPYAKTVLGEDCKKYKCDIIALQETKAAEKEWTSRNSYKYVLNELKRSHNGMGFGFNKQVLNMLDKVRYINDRISAALLSPFRSKKKSKMLVINVYMPTMQITKQDEGCDRDKTYEELKSLIKNNRQYIIIIMGDFNSKIGRNCNEECTERYSRGIRNVGKQ